MKYSLRSLMIVVTLAAVVAAYAGNVAYRQRQAAVHELSIQAISEKLCPPEDIKGTNTPRYLKQLRYHDRAAKAYRKAAWQPWLTVQTPAP